MNNTEFADVGGGGNSTFNSETGSWEKPIFPVLKPTSRKDVELLEQWLTAELARRAEGAQDTKSVMQATLPALNTAMSEIIRQVMVQCAERGKLMYRIWKSFIDLFSHVESAMSSATSSYLSRLDALNERLRQQNALYTQKLKQYKVEMERVKEQQERASLGRLQPLQVRYNIESTRRQHRE